MEYESEKRNTIYGKCILNMRNIPKSTSDLWEITK